MKNLLKSASLIFLTFTIICGIIYPAIVTGYAQLFFSDKANGSIIENKGSILIGQKFTDPKYLIGRPSEVSNLSPVSEQQQKLISKRIEFFKNLDPQNTSEIPNDLLMASGSGVDPNISIEAAKYQINRIAKQRNISSEDVQKIIDKYTTKRFLWIFGEPAVNVLNVNIELDKFK